MITLDLTPEQFQALRGIVADWLDEGFTTPPYEEATADVLEKFGFTREGEYIEEENE